MCFDPLTAAAAATSGMTGTTLVYGSASAGLSGIAAGGLSTMQMASLAFSGLSTVMGAYSQYQQGKYNAAVARNNAQIAQWQAEDARDRGRIEEQAHRRKVMALKGQQRAQAGASGVTLDDGTPLSILEDTAMLGELDALTIRSNAEREAFGYEVQATDSEAQARLAKSKGTYGAATSLLTGASSVADKWTRYKV